MKRPGRQGKRAVERKVRQAQGQPSIHKPRKPPKGLVGWITWK